MDAKGILWIPAYSANLLVRLDPATGKFTEIPLPMKDALPYVARVDPRDGAVWLGSAAADVLLRYDPALRTIRHLPAAQPGRAGAAPGGGPAEWRRVAGVRRVARDSGARRAGDGVFAGYRSQKA